MKGILSALLEKKKVIGIISAILIAVIAAFLGTSSESLKQAICEAPVVELPKEAPPAAAEVKAPDAAPTKPK